MFYSLLFVGLGVVGFLAVSLQVSFIVLAVYFMLSMLGKPFIKQHIEIFSQKIGLDISCELSSLFSGINEISLVCRPLHFLFNTVLTLNIWPSESFTIRFQKFKQIYFN